MRKLLVFIALWSLLGSLTVVASAAAVEAVEADQDTPNAVAASLLDVDAGVQVNGVAPELTRKARQFGFFPPPFFGGFRPGYYGGYGRRGGFIRRRHRHRGFFG